MQLKVGDLVRIKGDCVFSSSWAGQLCIVVSELVNNPRDLFHRHYLLRKLSDGKESYWYKDHVERPEEHNHG